uniref:Uncharacterized protein n=1 Tax=Lactuca sativa TaxID=4236 RepID=A0A9R1WK74_LACSA|nr:hypothetical protein LSAT_V11C100041030 [Lactuca sativa]
MGTMVSKNYNRIRIIYCTDFDFAFNIWKWTNKEVSSTVTYSITGWKVVPGSCLVFFPGYVVDKIVLAGPPLVKADTTCKEVSFEDLGGANVHN